MTLSDRVINTIRTKYLCEPDDLEYVRDCVSELVKDGGDRIIYLKDGREVTLIGGSQETVYVTSDFELVE